MKITAERLRKMGACREQVIRFEHLWPNGANVTRLNCLIAAENELNVSWLAVRVLKGHIYDVYEADADKVYEAWKHGDTIDPLPYWQGKAIAFYHAVKLQESEK